MAYTIAPANSQINEGAGWIDFVVTRTGSTTTENVRFSTVTFVSSGGPANNQDYGIDTNYTGVLNRTLTFSSTVQQNTVRVYINNDSAVEPNETFGVIVDNSSGTVLASTQFTIVDNDTVTVAPPRISIANASANEGSNLVFTVSLLDGRTADRDITVYFHTAPGTASQTAGGDYYYSANGSGSVVIYAGTQSATIPIITYKNGDSDASETMQLVLDDTSYGSLATTAATGTIFNADPVGATPPRISIANANANEGSNLVFTVSLLDGRTADRDITVYFHTAPGTASQTAGGDYYYSANGSGSVVIYAGTQSATIPIITYKNGDSDASETMQLVLDDTSYGTLATTAATGTIFNADPVGATPPRISIANANANEGSNLVFTVSLLDGRTADRDITVYFHTAPGTASQTAGGDYYYSANGSGSVVIYAGTQSATIPIITYKNGDSDASETMQLVLDDTSYGTLATTAATGTIFNADVPAAPDAIPGTTGTSYILQVNETKPGTIEQNDVSGDVIDDDDYRVTLTGGHTYTFGANANGSLTDTLDSVRIRLRDSAGNALGSSGSIQDKTDAGPLPGFTYTVPGSGAQTYYLAISASTVNGATNPPAADKTGTYTITLTDNGTAARTDDYSGDKSWTGSVTVGSSVTGVVETPNDTDWFRLDNLQAGRTYHIKTTGEAVGGASAIANSFFAVRNVDGDRILTGADYAWYDDAEGPNAVLDYTPKASGTYYVSVGAGGANHGQLTGGYRLQVSDVTPTTTPTVTDSTPTSTTVGVGAKYDTSTAYHATTTGSLQVTVSGLQPSGSMYAQLLDAGGNLIATGLQTAASLVFDAPVVAGADYLIRLINPGLGGATPTVSTQLTAASNGPLKSYNQIFSDSSQEHYGKISALADFAVRAYDDVVNPPAGSGWKGLDKLDGLSLGTFTGGVFKYLNSAAYVAVCGDALIVSFRGTDSKADVVQDLANLESHYAEFLVSGFIGALNSYIAAQTASGAIKKVFVTGHSLGAAMAQEFKLSHADDPNIEAVVFANPGFNDPFRNASHANMPNILDFRVSGDLVGYHVANLAPGKQELGDIVTIANESSESALSLHSKALYKAIAQYLDQHDLGALYATEMRDSQIDHTTVELHISNAGGDNWVIGPAEENVSLKETLGSDTELGSTASNAFEFHGGNDTVLDKGGSSDSITLFGWHGANFDRVGNDLVIHVTNPDTSVPPGHQVSELNTITIKNQLSGDVNRRVEYIYIDGQQKILPFNDVTLKATAGGYHPFNFAGAFVQELPNSTVKVFSVIGDAGAAGATFALDEFKAAAGATYSTVTDLSQKSFQILKGTASSAPTGASGAAALSEEASGTLTNILNVKGGDYNDDITGDDNANWLFGGSGNDWIKAGGGNDTLIGGDGAGNDTYDGGAGIDIVEYASTSLGISVDLAAGTAVGTEIGTDTLISIENIAAGFGADDVTGNGAANVLIGLDGRDLLTGAGGDDMLDGGDGVDAAAYSGVKANYSIASNADGTHTVRDLRTGSPDGTDILTDVEFLLFSDGTSLALRTDAIVEAAIESAGATSLVSAGHYSYFFGSGSSTGISLKFNGAPVFAGQFGGWSLIAGEQTATGYAVVWKNTVGQYTAWNADSNGNYINNSIGVVAGSDKALQSLENSFQQDLNGDGAIGLNVATTVVESFGATSLTQVGDNYFLYAKGTSTGPALKFNGAVVVAGQFSGWTLIGGEQTANGYAVAWKNTAGQYTAWNTDSNGNYINSSLGVVAGSDKTLQSLETSFQQDLNGNGVIGLSVATTLVESFGATSLTQAGDNYFLYAKGTSTGPALKFNGAVVVAGQFSGWTLIGGEQTANGYEVAWKNTAGQYTAWSTDSNGNYINSLIGVVAGSDKTLQSLETSFQQDLNGNGVIGLSVATTLVESFGATSLTQAGDNYFLYAKGTSTGPALKFNGAVVVTGQFSGWTLIGGEQTANGYEVAWKNTAGQYTVWNADSNGNYINSPIGVVAGSDQTLQSLESSFQQDLNGDGVVGLNVPTTLIESSGATSLAQVGNNFFLFAKGTSTGPVLKFNGAAVTTGQFSGWTLIGGEQTAAGYEVAWKNTAGQYTVWNADSNGNYINSPIGVVAGSDQALQSLESSFQQDLNGDGVVGLNVPTTLIESSGATSLAQVGNNFFLFAKGTSTGPVLKFNGAAVTTGQFSGWTLIGGEQTAAGYEVAWKNTAGQYTVWDADSNGNYINSPIGVVAGSDQTLQSLETGFHQDLNGDGRIGNGAPTVVESFGATSLTQLGDNYFLYAKGTSTGPALKFNGAAVTTGQFSGWTLIGGEQTATGYEVAWKNTAGQYTVWDADNNGNYLNSPIGVVSGTDAALQSVEANLRQDLNGDGQTGPTITLQPGAEGQDLWITSVYTYNDDYGVDDAQLKVGGWGDVYDSLIKFDLSNVKVSHVASATLQLYNVPNSDGHSTGLSVEEAQTAWNESFGWYNLGGTRPANGGSATADPPNFSFKHLTNVAAPGPGWVTIDVTDAVNDWLSNPSSNNGLLIRPLSHDDNNFDFFVSSDATGENAPFRPVLLIHPDVLV